MKMPWTLAAVLFFTLTGHLVVAQNFISSGGLTFIRGKTKASEKNAGIVEKMSINGLTYFPGVLLIKGLEKSFSMGLPLTLGLRSNEGVGGNSLSFGMNAPLVFDYNIGHHSNTASQRLIGGYFGAGFGFTYAAVTETSSFGTYTPNAISYGPLARAGFRFALKGAKELVTFTIGGYYKYGLEDDSFKSGGISLLIHSKVTRRKKSADREEK